MPQDDHQHAEVRLRGEEPPVLEGLHQCQMHPFIALRTALAFALASIFALVTASAEIIRRPRLGSCVVLSIIVQRSVHRR